MGLGLVAVGMVITFVGLGDKVSQFGNSKSQRSSFRILDFGISETSYKEYQFWNYKPYNLIDKLQGVKIAKLIASLEHIVRFGGNLAQLFRHIP